MIELTEEQHQAVAGHAGSPPLVIDPTTHTRYVLVREEVYDRVENLIVANDDDESLHELYPHVMQVFGSEGWDDPAMDIYNELDPRRSQ